MKRATYEKIQELLPKDVHIYGEGSGDTRIGTVLSVQWKPGVHLPKDTGYVLTDKVYEDVCVYETRSMVLQLAELADQLAKDLREAAG